MSNTKIGFHGSLLPDEAKKKKRAESIESSLPRMIFNWAACATSLVVSNLSCLALSSFFFSILPTKRNLLTYLNTVLVLSITAAVNVMVGNHGGVIILGNLTSLQKILMKCYVIKTESRLKR